MRSPLSSFDIVDGLKETLEPIFLRITLSDGSGECLTAGLRAVEWLCKGEGACVRIGVGMSVGVGVGTVFNLWCLWRCGGVEKESKVGTCCSSSTCRCCCCFCCCCCCCCCRWSRASDWVAAQVSIAFSKHISLSFFMQISEDTFFLFMTSISFLRVSFSCSILSQCTFHLMFKSLDSAL